MYTKKLSESRGLRIAMRVAVLGAITIAVAVAFGSVPALVVLAAGLMVGFLIELRPQRSAVHPLRTAAREGGSHDGNHVLVVANASLQGDGLARELVGHGTIDVLAPPLPSRIHLGVTDIDRELADARRRLDESLAWAKDHGLPARGEVGDADAVTAIADELRGFGADEVVVVSDAREGRRITRRELEQLRADLELPVREFAV